MTRKDSNEWLESSNWKYDERDKCYRLGMYRSFSIITNENGETVLDYKHISNVEVIFRKIPLRILHLNEKNNTLEYTIYDEIAREEGKYCIYSV